MHNSWFDSNFLLQGCGDDGALGHGNTENILVPKTVRSLGSVTISDVTCGSRHTIAITNNGEVGEGLEMNQWILTISNEIEE